MTTNYKATISHILIWTYRTAVILIAILLIFVLFSNYWMSPTIKWIPFIDIAIPLTEGNKLIKAAIIGFIGSFGYFSALYFGFILNDDIRDSICPPKEDCSNMVRGAHVFWFVLLGGAVALVFQIPESVFVPIQAFILGATWPTVVTQVLSGKQASIEKGLKESVIEKTYKK